MGKVPGLRREKKFVFQKVNCWINGGQLSRTYMRRTHKSITLRIDIKESRLENNMSFSKKVTWVLNLQYTGTFFLSLWPLVGENYFFHCHRMTTTRHLSIWQQTIIFCGCDEMKAGVYIVYCTLRQPVFSGQWTPCLVASNLFLNLLLTVGYAPKINIHSTNWIWSWLDVLLKKRDIDVFF